MDSSIAQDTFDTSAEPPATRNRCQPLLRILTVGDGDLSFSLSLVRAFGPDQIDLTASVLPNTEQELVETYSNARDTLRELREGWNVLVLFGVDATRLDESLLSASSTNITRSTQRRRKTYDIIIFNHPHLGTAILADSERDHALRHHSLLAHYMHSASKCLTENGVIHLCLCGTQPITWNVECAASRHGLEIYHECSTSAPVSDWLSLAFENTPRFEEATRGGADEDHNQSMPRALLLEPQPVRAGYPAPRRYRNGRLGSKHFLGKYGYRHRRTRGDSYGGNDVDMAVHGSTNILLRKSRRLSANTSIAEHTKPAIGPNHCKICSIDFETDAMLISHQQSPALPDADCLVHRDDQTGKEFSTGYALKTFERQRRDRLDHDGNDDDR